MFELKRTTGALLTLATAACMPAQEAPISQRAYRLQEQYGTLLGTQFYAVGHQVKCEMDAEAAGTDPVRSCTEETLRLVAAEQQLTNFRESYPEELAYLDQNCVAEPFVPEGFAWPVLALDCRFEQDPN